MWTALQQLLAPSVHVRLSPLIAMAALECLVAIWAATSRGYWFWRALAAVGAVLLMVPISAWEPAWLFALSSTLIVISLARRPWRQYHAVASETWDRQRDAQPRFRFSLQDLFLLILLVGLSLPGLVEIWRHFRPITWLAWLVSGTALAVLAILSYAFAIGPRRRLSAVLLLFALPACAAAVRAAGDWMRVSLLFGGSGIFATDFATLIVVELELVVALVAILALAQAARSPARSPKYRLACAGAITALLALSVGWVGWFYIPMIQRVPRATKFEVAGNHYDRILEIARRVSTINPGNAAMADLRLGMPSAPTAQELASLYAELLPLLEDENAVPYDPDLHANESYIDSMLAKDQIFRGLARALQAESQSARQSQQPGLAGDYALATLRLSDMLGRGGSGIDALVGRAIESVGYVELARLRSEMSPAQMRSTIASLERSLHARDSAASLRAREADFGSRVFGWLSRIERPLLQLSSQPIPWEAALDEATKRRIAANRLLQTDLAIRLFRQDHGRLPQDLSELVPGHLAALPLDPYSDQPIRYQPDASGDFRAYSVGHDGQDNGGRFGNFVAYIGYAGYDLDLDTLTRP